MAEKFHVGRGSYDGAGLTIFPVWSETAEITGHCWKSSHLTVGELESGATVNNLIISNNGHRPHVALEGDLFEGGQQNRVLAQGHVIARGEQREVAVACVEEGRWHGAGAHRGGSRRATYGVRTGMTSVRAREGERRANARITDDAQSEVWERIRRHEHDHGGVEGHSLIESLMQMDARRSSSFPAAAVLPGQRGVIIGIAGEIAAAEFFGSTSGLTARWDGILSAARYEAMSVPSIQTPGWAARDFAVTLQGLPVGDNLAAPITTNSPLGPVAVSSFALSFGLIHAAVFNNAHPVLAEAGANPWRD